MQKSPNVVWHHATITKEDRFKLQGHKGCVIWLTGLPSSGKSTLANEIEAKLYEMGKRTYVLDGDNIRHGLNHNLGFSPEDREENIRRVGEIAKLFTDAGVIALAAFIAPYKKDRDSIKNSMSDGEFIELYVKCSVSECENRDPKGMYKKAREGVIKEFTGVSAPYEEPVNPGIIVDTEKYNLEECVNQVIDYLEQKRILNING